MKPIFKKEDWYYYGRWVQVPLSGSFWTPWFRAESVMKIFPGVDFHQVLFFDGYTWGMVVDQRQVAEFIFRLFRKKQLLDFISHFEAMALQCEKKHAAILEADSEPKDYVRKMFNTYAEIIGIWTIGFNFDPVVTELILKEGIVKDVEELLPLIEQSVSATWLQQQAREIRRLAAAVRQVEPTRAPAELTVLFLQSRPSLLLEFNQHVSAYRWFGTHHWTGEEYSLERCIGEVQQELERRTGARSRRAKSPRLASHPLLNLLALFAYWRTHCAELTAKVVCGSRKKLTQLAQSFGLCYEELLLFSPGEILSLMERRKTMPVKVPTERLAGYGVYLERGNERIVVGLELQRLVESLLGTVNNTGELKGMIACRGGVVQGRVRVIISPSDIGRFQIGEILVVPETTPDFVPLMKMAVAIITEAGGITSHAAIVARELGKPCIIGTKIATRVLKDGDRVEVDAEKGVVRILHKK